MTRFKALPQVSSRLQSQLLRTARNCSMALALPLLTWMATTSTTALAQTNNAAAPAIRPEVVKLLQASQDALREGQLDKALTVAQQAMAMPNISKDEQCAGRWWRPNLDPPRRLLAFCESQWS